MATFGDGPVTTGDNPYARFRGNWSPSVANPQPRHFFAFTKTAPPAAPLSTVRETKAPPAAIYKLVEEYSEQVVQVSPPSDAKLTILDRYRNYRSAIKTDGECINNLGQTIGYINIDSGEAGSINEEFLGEIVEHIDSLYFIQDDKGEKIGELDPGRAVVRDVSGTTIAELSNNGETLGARSAFLGQFEGFSFHDMKIIALYLLLIDPGMLNELEG